MKEIEKNLKIYRSTDATTYICKRDDTVLVEIHNDGTFRMMTSCPHFVWWELTKASYYLGIGDISEEELQDLRKNAIIVISEGMFVHLLVSDVGQDSNTEGI